MSVSVIFVNHNGLERTRNAIKSVRKSSPQSESVVVDNNSTDGSVECLRREFSDVRLLPLSENRGFGAGSNKGADVALGEFLFFLNSDTVLTEDTPILLATMMQGNPYIGVCGPRVVIGDDSFQLSFGSDPSLLNEWKLRGMRKRLQRSDASVQAEFEPRYSATREVDWVTGAALMIRRDVFQKVGGFDETFFMYFEDADLCRRVRKLGLKVLYVPSTKIIHFGGDKGLRPESKIALEYRRSQLHYYRKHVGGAGYFLLRTYLISKFSFRWLLSFTGRREARPVAAAVVKTSVRGL
ncbi:MAG: glycosyltransferase family 2 protein [Bacteroidota bacterium]